MAARITSTPCNENQCIGEAMIEITGEIESMISNLPSDFDQHALQKTVDIRISGEELFKKRMLDLCQITMLKDTIEQVRILTLWNQNIEPK